MRIRTIKPEFWRSDDIACLDLPTRLLYIGLWSYVDDAGRGIDNPSSIAADLYAPDLARDDGANAPEVFARVRGGLATLSDNGLIRRYQSDGRRFLHVVAWTKHQRIDKPTRSRFPEPPAEQASDKGEHEAPRSLPESSANPREASANPPEDSTAGTGEQGNRGTGEASGELPPAATPKTAAKKTAYPPDWEPAANQIAYADEHNIDLWAEAEKFRDRNLAEGSKYADWDRAFANWLRRGNDNGWAAKKQPAKTGLGCANPFEGW